MPCLPAVQHGCADELWLSKYNSRDDLLAKALTLHPQSVKTALFGS